MSLKGVQFSVAPNIPREYYRRHDCSVGYHGWDINHISKTALRNRCSGRWISRDNDISSNKFMMIEFSSNMYVHSFDNNNEEAG